MKKTPDYYIQPTNYGMTPESMKAYFEERARDNLKFFKEKVNEGLTQAEMTRAQDHIDYWNKLLEEGDIAVKAEMFLIVEAQIGMQRASADILREYDRRLAMVTARLEVARRSQK